MKDAYQEPPIDVVKYKGEMYYRIDPDTIDVSQMTEVKKVTDVFAYQYFGMQKFKVPTVSGGQLETINEAKHGDWIVYNIGNSEGETLEEKLENADIKVITDENFKKLYEDKIDESDYSDYNTAKKGEGKLYSYIGKAIYAGRVPFNFVIKATWGKDQFIKAGGYIILNTNTSKRGKRDIYGTSGARKRKAGQMEKTYGVVHDDELEEDLDPMEEQYKMVIRADRSPIAGIQFNNIDLAKAYERIGRENMAAKYM